MFVGRERELAALKKEFDAPRPALLIVYGRRRVGKSRLIQEAVAGRRVVYFQASRETILLNLDSFKRDVAVSLGEDPILAGLSTWISVLHYLGDIAWTTPSLIVVLDEFSFLCDGDPALPSIIQKFWDAERTRGGTLKLVLCGSIISSMGGLLAEKNPLYGRQTGVFDIEPLPLRDAALFFPDYSPEEKIIAYAMLGGVPYYLEACDPKVSLKDNTLALLLSNNGRLIDEPTNLLQSELREIKVYSSVLHAIADGCRDSNAIKNRVIGAAPGTSISPYLDRLQAMRLIRAERSLDADAKARNTRYVITDPLVAFWSRFVRPNASSITLGFGEDVYRHKVAPELSLFMGDAFEEICREDLRRFSQEFLSAPAQDIGKIWAADYDLDGAGLLLDGTMVYGECKWWLKPVGENILEKLITEAARTTYGAGQPRRHFVLYSRLGFTDDLVRRASSDPSIHLRTLGDLVAAPG